MAELHSAVIFEHISGSPADRYMNNFYFSNVSDPLVAHAAIATALQGFYNDTNGTATQEVGNRISSVVSRAALSAKVRTWEVDLATGAETFVAETPWTLINPTTSSPYASEAAVVLSFHGTLDGSEADRRKRGRIYVGPLTTVAVQTAADGVARPDTFLRDALIESAKDLKAELELPAGIIWSVYSRTGGFMSEVTGGWVDDAMDTQRRRGEAPVVRTVFSGI